MTDTIAPTDSPLDQTVSVLASLYELSPADERLLHNYLLAFSAFRRKILRRISSPKATRNYIIFNDTAFEFPENTPFSDDDAALILKEFDISFTNVYRHTVLKIHTLGLARFVDSLGSVGGYLIIDCMDLG